jgi:SCY1-like protein 2
VIKKLGERVEKEHDQFLRDSQRLEDRSSTGTIIGGNGVSSTTNVDFENLVGRGNDATVKADTAVDTHIPWEDDVWGTIFSEDVRRFLYYSVVLDLIVPFFFKAKKSSPALQTSHIPRLSAPLSPVPSNRPLAHTRRLSISSVSTPTAVSQPGLTSRSQTTTSQFASAPIPPKKPNYEISWSPPTTPSAPPPPNIQPILHPPRLQAVAPASTTPAFLPPPLMGDLLVPSKLTQTTWGNTTKKVSKDTWSDFDPLL